MNKKITKILSIIALMFLAIVISGCEMPGGTNSGVIEKVKLDTPTNVVVDQESFELTWDNVENAVYYKVYVYKNNVCVETVQAESGVVLTELDAVLEGSYEVSIVAFGDSETHKNSAFSERVTFTLPEKQVDPEVVPLTTPTNVKVTYNESTKKVAVSFNDAADYVNAKEYTVIVYSGTTDILTTKISANGGSIDVSTLSAGTYTVKVRVVSNNILFENSQLSANSNSFEIESAIEDGGLTLTGYYKNANGLTGDELEKALRDIMKNTHTKYSSYTDCKNQLPYIDEDPNNTNNMILFYTGQSIKKSTDLTNDWNREHVWCQSLGWFKTSGAGSDLHHIRPCNISVNSSRGNKKFGTASGQYLPTNEYKGDVARIIFYLMIAYDEAQSYNFTIIAQSLDLLLEWNEIDPVSNLEIQRNVRVQAFQGNYNPFIDYPQFAEMIWG